MEPDYRAVPVAEAAGGIGAAQVAIGVVALVWAIVLAVRPPRARRESWWFAGVVVAFLPVAVGHVALVTMQLRAMGGPPDDLLRVAESGTVHTWIGWTATGTAFVAMLLARLRFR